MVIDLNRTDTRTGSGPLLTLRQAASGGERMGWQVGQVLRATVVSFTPQGNVNLDVDGVRLQSNQSALGLQTGQGQSLRLEVMEAGKLPVLRVLDGPVSMQEAARQAAREALPRQASLEQVLQRSADQLRQLANGAGSSQQAQAARQLIGALPEPGRLGTVEGLRQALNQSGLFLENSLGQQSRGGPVAPLTHDLKANLLRLVGLLRQGAEGGTAPGGGGARPGAPASGSPPPLQPMLTYPAPGRGTVLQAIQNQTALSPSPPTATTPAAAGTAATPPPGLAAVATPGGRAELVQQLEAGLARLQLNQLSSGPLADSSRPTWHVELPLRGGDGEFRTLTLAFSHEREGDGETIAPLWTVNLHFELEKLGPVRAGLSLVGERHVSVGIWAEQEEAVMRFQGSLERLRTGLAEAGLTVGHVGVRQGESQPPKRPRSGMMTSLLDEEA